MKHTSTNITEVRCKWVGRCEGKAGPCPGTQGVEACYEAAPQVDHRQGHSGFTPVKLTVGPMREHVCAQTPTEEG